MGIPSETSHAKKVVCVGGGLGVAPVYPQARAYKDAGAYVIGVIGFRTKDLIFKARLVEAQDLVIIATDHSTVDYAWVVDHARHLVEQLPE